MRRYDCSRPVSGRGKRAKSEMRSRAFPTIDRSVVVRIVAVDRVQARLVWVVIEPGGTAADGVHRRHRSFRYNDQRTASLTFPMHFLSHLRKVGYVTPLLGVSETRAVLDRSLHFLVGELSRLRDIDLNDVPVF